MAEKADVKAEALPDLDDLLQCPVCYEIPSGQIFQCNEGHHVCGRCKARLSQCPVCRALFFGTRNYAMEELIANVRKLRAFKLGGKVTTGSGGSGSNTPAEEAASASNDNNGAEDDDDASDQNLPALRAPQACKGLFRCLCCKNGNSIRLPAARLLNHLRYFHSPELIEGQSENGEYVQAWQFSTAPGRIVTAVRVSDMGIFFLIIEISNESVYAWLSMAAAPWVTNEFSYTVTISGNDREAIFSDCVWSVRSCEGFLKKRGRCLVVSGLDARALVAPATISGKLSVHRVRPDEVHQHLQHPRAVLRVASRGGRDPPRDPPLVNRFVQHLQNDVAMLSQLMRDIDDIWNPAAEAPAAAAAAIEPPAPAPAPAPAPEPAAPSNPEPALSRNARRRMRNRLRATLNEAQDVEERVVAQNSSAQRPNGHVPNNVVHRIGYAVHSTTGPVAAPRNNAPSNSSVNSDRRNDSASNNPIRIQTGLAIVQPSPASSAPAARQNAQASAASQRPTAPVQVQTGLAIVHHPVQNHSVRGGSANGVAGSGAGYMPAPAAASGSAGPQPQPQNANRTNKKKRRHRR